MKRVSESLAMGRSMATIVPTRLRNSWPPFGLMCLINNIHGEGLP